MEVYVLDSLLRRTEVVDRFNSLIWTERFRDIGDFELVIQSTSANRRRFTAGTRIVHNESVRVMTVETVEDHTDDQGQKLLKVKGRSLEAVLEDRAAIGITTGIHLEEWYLYDTPEWVARTMFANICVLGQLNAKDIIPYLHWGPPGHPDGPNAGDPATDNIFPTDTIPESNFQISWIQKPNSLYNAIKEVCDIYDLGFRLYRNGDTSQLFFNIYTGSNRTTQQNSLEPVIFSPELRNLLNTTEFTTIAKTKNCAYVHAKYNDVYYFRTVYPPDVDPDVEGFDRRLMFVSHTVDEPIEGVTLTEYEIHAQMDRKALDEIAKNRAFTAFDGVISQHPQWKYGVHYHLGDLVSMQNSDGLVNSMRVTEQIFVSDQEGDRAYPTLAINLSVMPGSWESWGFQAWEDVELTEYWDNQP